MTELLKTLCDLQFINYCINITDTIESKCTYTNHLSNIPYKTSKVIIQIPKTTIHLGLSGDAHTRTHTHAHTHVRTYTHTTHTQRVHTTHTHTPTFCTESILRNQVLYFCLPHKSAFLCSA